MEKANASPRNAAPPAGPSDRRSEVALNLAAAEKPDAELLKRQFSIKAGAADDGDALAW
jgi:hypothetical protein